MAITRLSLDGYGARRVSSGSPPPSYSWSVPTNASNGTTVRLTVFDASYSTIVDQNTAVVSGGVATITASDVSGTSSRLAAIDNWTGTLDSTPFNGGFGIATRA